MRIMNEISALVKAVAEKMEMQNRQTAQRQRCQTCRLPYICLQNVVAPVFSSFFGRKFISDELYYGCDMCIFVVALPEPVTENDTFILKRQLERRLAKFVKCNFSDIVKSNIVLVTQEYVYIKM